MRSSEITLTALDGVPLLTRYFPAEAGGPGRTLVLIHGACEHGDRYQHVVPLLNARGWSVILPDLRGHGRSGGTPTHVKHFDTYVADLEVIREHFGWNPRNTCLLGHSMGGLIAIRYGQSHPRQIAALTLLSPLLGLEVEVPFLTLAAGKVLSYILPTARFRSRVHPADTTRNLEALEARNHDPYIHRSVTARWFYAMKAALKQAWADADRITMPTLVVQAGQDRIVDPLAPAFWLETIGTPDRALHLVSNSLHELLNEPGWESTVSMVSHWLLQRLDGRAALRLVSA